MGKELERVILQANEQFDDVRNCDLAVGMSYKN